MRFVPEGLTNLFKKKSAPAPDVAAPTATFGSPSADIPPTAKSTDVTPAVSQVGTPDAERDANAVRITQITNPVSSVTTPSEVQPSAPTGTEPSAIPASPDKAA